MIFLPLIAMGLIAFIATVLMFDRAYKEPNPGKFWDLDNPSGFHRFVLPTFFALIAGFIFGLALRTLT